MTDEFQAALLELINNEISLDSSIPVEAETDLLMTGLVDSLGVVQIVDWMEERLGLAIEPADVVIEHFQTVRAMTEYLQRRSAGV